MTKEGKKKIQTFGGRTVCGHNQHLGELPQALPLYLEINALRIFLGMFIVAALGLWKNKVISQFYEWVICKLSIH